MAWGGQELSSRNDDSGNTRLDGSHDGVVHQREVAGALRGRQRRVQGGEVGPEEAAVAAASPGPASEASRCYLTCQF